MNLKKNSLLGFTLLSFTLLSTNVDAQRKPGKKSAGGAKPPSGYTTTPSAGTKNTNNNNSGYPGTNGGNTPTSNQGGYGAQSSSNNQGNTPYKVIPSSGGGGLNDTFKVSLRNDNIIQKNLVKDIEPLPYSHIREDDAVFKQRLWRIIDAREKMNLPFGYSAVEENGSQRFISILYNAIKSGEVTAFLPEPMGDDRFTTPMTKDDIMKAFGSKTDTVPVPDMNGNILYNAITTREVSPDSIYKFKIKEEIVFDKEESRLVTRILGICPMMPKYTSDGSTKVGDVQLFWIYYPDIRTILSKYEAYNPKNYGKRITWDAIFQERMFASYIIKSTMNNPKNESLKTIIRDPMFELYEGEKIKTKIFDYEQNLWAY
jgi:gliding motility associated protien GldN